MALDRQNKDTHYQVGRLIAITEHYAGKRFGPLTKSNMFTHPARNLQAFARYVDTQDQYYLDIDATPPVTVHSTDEQSRMIVGYYYQRSAYDKTSNPESDD